jgi:hypothetical protein
MLLRIDAYPAEAPSHQRPQPLYACLATSASGTDDADMAGRLLTIGRKTGHVVFGGDKSVSREHCILRLVSANKTHQQHVVGISNTRIPPPMKPRNPEEIKACDNDLQMCVVLENIGKVGSFVVQERVPTLNDSNDKNDNSDTDDDTDEEANTGVAASASQQMLGVQLSPAARALIPDPSTVTLKYVGPGESIVLEKLSSNNKNDKPVIVQCGKMGSTIVVPTHSDHSEWRGRKTSQGRLACSSTLYRSAGNHHAGRVHHAFTHCGPRYHEQATCRLVLGLAYCHVQLSTSTLGTHVTGESTTGSSRR